MQSYAIPYDQPYHVTAADLIADVVVDGFSKLPSLFQPEEGGTGGKQRSCFSEPMSWDETVADDSRSRSRSCFNDPIPEQYDKGAGRACGGWDQTDDGSMPENPVDHMLQAISSLQDELEAVKAEAARGREEVAKLKAEIAVRDAVAEGKNGKKHTEGNNGKKEEKEP